MPVLLPNLSMLPPPQVRLWQELGVTPGSFTLYGVTALALRLGHRSSVDFDFFSNEAFDPERLASTIPYLRDAERVQMAPDKLTCRVDRGGPVLISFFGGLGLGQVAESDLAQGPGVHVASLLDLAGTKMACGAKESGNEGLPRRRCAIAARYRTLFRWRSLQAPLFMGAISTLSSH